MTSDPLVGQGAKHRAILRKVGPQGHRASAARARGRIAPRHRHERFLCFVVILAIFFAWLGAAKIVGSHEARVALTARTMVESGWPWDARAVPATVPDLLHGAGPGVTAMEVNPWFIPVFEGSIRLQKPPLPYWCTAVVFRCFGVDETSARIIPALLGALSALLVWTLARDLGGRLLARWAILVWASTYFVADEYRKAMADPYLAFFSLSAICAWSASSDSQHLGGPRRALLTSAFYGSVALGLLSKGPVLLVHVGVPLLLLRVLYRRRSSLPWGHHLVGACLLLAVVLPWPLYVVARLPGAVELWRYESVGEFADNIRNAGPMYYYLPALFQLSLPWTPMWVAGIVLAVIRRRRTMLFAAIWTLCVVVIFSFAHVKKNAYLLPLMPAQTLLVAGAIRMTLAWKRRWKGHWPRQLVEAHAVLGATAAVVVAVLMVREFHAGRLAIHPLTMVVVLLAIVVVAGLVPLVQWTKTDLRRRLTTQAVCFSGLIVLTIGVLGAARQNLRADLLRTRELGNAGDGSSAVFPTREIGTVPSVN